MEKYVSPNMSVGIISISTFFKETLCYLYDFLKILLNLDAVKSWAFLILFYYNLEHKFMQ